MQIRTIGMRVGNPSVSTVYKHRLPSPEKYRKNLIDFNGFIYFCNICLMITFSKRLRFKQSAAVFFVVARRLWM